MLVRVTWAGFRAAMAVAVPALMLAACNTSTPLNQGIDPAIASLYAPVDESPYKVPGVNLRPIDPQFYRQTVAIPDGIPKEPGVIVVDPASRFLYFTEADGMAVRYGIGVGRDGFLWSGTATIHDKTAWPKWFPPKEMIDREPKFARYADGMDGGIRNPLGARALYIWQGKKDTLYRLHGTNDPSSIGKAVSSGCVRMLNQDVIDLYNRVPLETKVIVLPAPGALPVIPGDPVKVGSL